MSRVRERSFVVALVAIAVAGAVAGPRVAPATSSGRLAWADGRHTCRPVVVVDARTGRRGALCRGDAVALAMALGRLHLERCEGAGPVVGSGRLGLALVVAEGRPGAPCHLAVRPLPARMRLALGLPLPVNESTADDLALLPGIGPRLSARIVAHREQYGRLRTPDDLLAVRGVGLRTAARLERWLTFE